MDSFALLYLLYVAKLGVQFSIFLLSLAHANSPVLKYLAPWSALLAVSPVFHAIVHLRGISLSYTSLVAYLCLSAVLAALWYAPMIEIEDVKSVLIYVLVTVLDGITLSIFLLCVFNRWRRGDPKEGDEEAGSSLLNQENMQQNHPRTAADSAVRREEFRDVPPDRMGTREMSFGSTMERQRPGIRPHPEMGVADVHDGDGDGDDQRVSRWGVNRDTAIYAPVVDGEHNVGRDEVATKQKGINRLASGRSQGQQLGNFGDRGLDPVPVSHRTASLSTPIPQRRAAVLGMDDVHPALRSSYFEHGAKEEGVMF